LRERFFRRFTLRRRMSFSLRVVPSAAFLTRISLIWDLMFRIWAL